MQNNDSFMLFLSIVFLVLALMLVMYLFINTRVNKEKEDSIFLTNNKNAKYSKLHTMYATFTNFRPTRNYLLKLKAQFELLVPNNEKFAKETAMKVALAVWGASIVALTATVLMQPSMFMFICVCTLVYVINAQVVEKAVAHYSLTLLKQMDVFFSDVRSFYIDFGSADEAVYEAMCSSKSMIMKAHAEKIYGVLTAVDFEEALTIYNESVPNQFLQRFVSISITQLIYGDKVVNGQPLYLTNLKNLRKDLNEELRHKDDVAFSFKCFVPMTIAPIFALDAISAWGVDTVPELEEFYNGQMGILAAIGCFLCMLFAYRRVVFLKDPELVDKSDHYFLRWLGAKPLVNKFLTNYENENYGKMMQLQDLLKRTGSRVNDKLFLLKRLGFGLIAFVVTIIISIILIANTRYRCLNSFATVASTANSATETEVISIMMLTDYYTTFYKDFDLLREYNESVTEENTAAAVNATVKAFFEDKLYNDLQMGAASVTEERAMEIIMQYNTTHSSSSEIALAYYGTSMDTIFAYTEREQQRAEKLFSETLQKVNSPEPLKQENLQKNVVDEVVSRVSRYQNAYFHWYYVLAACIVSIIAYMMPYSQLKSKEKLLQAAMEDEVIIFQSVILSLMYFEEMDVETILTWLCMFSNIFGESLNKCLNSLSVGEDEALQQLMEDEPFPQFRRIVENLRACDRIGVTQAFNELDAELLNFQEERKQSNAKMLAQNVSSASMMAFAPLMAVVFLYLVGPFMIESFSQLSTYMTEMAVLQG